jgi:hypoxanthine phosphoribosyltransferase
MPTDPPGDVRTAPVSPPDPAARTPAPTSTGSAHPFDDPALGEVVVSEQQIRARIVELGAQITADYADDPPLLVCVLKGAFVFLADLARAIELPVEIDFMAVSSYGASTRSSGVVRIVKDLDPTSLDVCVLFVRQGNQKTEEELRYVGFDIPPAFVLGYGLDVGERYRNLPYVCRFRGDA